MVLVKYIKRVSLLALTCLLTTQAFAGDGTLLGGDPMGGEVQPPSELEKPLSGRLMQDLEIFRSMNHPDVVLGSKKVVDQRKYRIFSDETTPVTLWPKLVRETSLRKPSSGEKKECLHKQGGLKIGGWVQQGINFSQYNPADGWNATATLADRANDYQLNQLWLYMDKQANNGGHGLAWGGHIDACYGTDSRYGKMYGFEDRFDSEDNYYALCFPQMYLDLQINRLTIRGGHFASILDYESVPAPANAFYTHSVSYLVNPPLMTGLRADYKVGRFWTLTAGFETGFMEFENSNSSYDLVTGIRCDLTKDTVLRWASIYGRQGEANQADIYVHSIVWEQQVTSRLKNVLVHDLGDMRTLSGPRFQWYGLVDYIEYKTRAATPLWINLRAEWFHDDDGMAVKGIASQPYGRTSTPGWDGMGFAGDFYNVSLGLKWAPLPCLLVRPELRYDWYEGAGGLVGGAPVAGPFNAGQNKDQFLFAMDTVLLF